MYLQHSKPSIAIHKHNNTCRCSFLLGRLPDYLDASLELTSRCILSTYTHTYTDLVHVHSTLINVDNSLTDVVRFLHPTGREAATAKQYCFYSSCKSVESLLFD